MRSSRWLVVLFVLGAVLATPALSEDEVKRPAADKACAVAKAYLLAVAHRRFDEAVSYWDRLSALQRLFPSEWNELRDIERRELLDTMPQVLTRGASGLHDGVKWQELDLTDEVFEAKTAANGLVAVHFPLRSMEGHGASPDSALLLGLRDNKVRIVDIKISTNPFWTEANRKHYESLGPHRDPLLYFWKELMGQLPPPGSAFILPPPPPTPEWASRDAFRMDLPVVPGAPLDEHVPNPKNLPWGERVMVSLSSNGYVIVRPNGRRSLIEARPLMVESPAKQMQVLRLVAERLRSAASQEGLRGADGESSLRLVVRADREARWQFVTWLFAICRHPTIGIRHVEIAVDRGEEPRFGLLRLDLADVFAPPSTDPLQVALTRVDGAYTRIQVGERAFDLPPGAKSYEPQDPKVAAARAEKFKEIRVELRKLRDSRADLGVSLGMPRPYGLKVPHDPVVQLLVILQEEDIPLVEVQSPGAMHFINTALGQEPEGSGE